MPTSTRFTDHQLKLFYGNVLKHYHDCAKRKADVREIYDEMYLAVQHALNTPFGSLSHLDDAEKQKVYTAFNTIFYALPAFQKQGLAQKAAFIPRLSKESEPNAAYVIYERSPYYRNDPVFDWLLIRSITLDCHYQHRYGGGLGGWPSGSSGRNHGHSNNNDNADVAKLLALLALLFAAAVAAALACVASYYMLNEFLGSAERFYYGEGWLRGALMLASSVAFGLTSTILSFNFISPMLISLAMAAGLNPAVVVIAGTICVAVIGAALGTFAMDLLYGYTSKNNEAMDPNDSLRFRLTNSDEKHLLSLGLDPIKVKCAMFALRAEMADILDKDKSGKDIPIPSFFNRVFGDGDRVQKLLQKVRQLRSGELCEVDVSGLHFDCRKPMDYSVAPAMQEAPRYEGMPLPSAPPAYEEIYTF